MSTDRRPSIARLLPIVATPLICGIATIANGLALEVFKYQNNWQNNGEALIAAALIDLALIGGALYYSHRPH